MGDSYACHNTTRLQGYWAQEREATAFQPGSVWVWIDNRMSRECRYDMRDTDKRCEGCRK